MEVRSAPAWAVWGSWEPAPLREGVGENVCAGEGWLPQPGASGRDHVSLRGTDERPSGPPLKAPPCKIETVTPRPVVILFNDTDRVSLRIHVSRGGGTERRNNGGSPYSVGWSRGPGSHESCGLPLPPSSWLPSLVRPPLTKPCTGYYMHILVLCSRPASPSAPGHRLCRHPVSGEDWLWERPGSLARSRSPGPWPQSLGTEPNQQLTRAGCEPPEPEGLGFYSDVLNVGSTRGFGMLRTS